MSTEVTVGIDIGTSSVKAIAADGDGNVVARARVPHQVDVPAPERFEHDAAAAWRDGPRRRAGRARRPRRPGCQRGGDGAVAHRGRRAGHAAHAGPALRRRARAHRRGARRREPTTRPVSFLGFLRWLHETVPTAHGFWPAQSVANHALARRGGARHHDRVARVPAVRLDRVGRRGRGRARDHARRAPAPRAHRLGVRPRRRRRPRARVGVHRRDGRAARRRRRPGRRRARAPRHHAHRVGRGPRGRRRARLRDHPAHRVGQLPRRRPEQRGRAVPRLGHAVPRAAGRPRARSGRGAGVGAVPAGERVPLNDHTRRASLHHLDLTHDAAAIVRATDEASAFV